MEKAGLKNTLASEYDYIKREWSIAGIVTSNDSVRQMYPRLHTAN